ncbi:hypothetical protein TSMEX_001132 [Taenia solium]|eukprot:TsM_000506600 transcript=TsM_000506600 gene=TsM_000506600
MKQFRELRILFLKQLLTPYLPPFVSFILTSPCQIAKLLPLICVVQKCVQHSSRLYFSLKENC